MTQSSSQRSLLITAGAACILGIAILYGLVPYTYSHLDFGSQMVPVFQALWLMWNRLPDFQHGMLVPFLAGLVVYLDRKKLAQIPIKGWWPGMLCVVLTLALFWAGRRVDNQYIGFFSIQILLAALVLWLLGWRWLGALAFPLAFLVFAWPMPFLDNRVTFPLRMFMSSASAGTLNLFGLPVVQNGTGLRSAADPQAGFAEGQLFEVDVADPCSGIRSLFALMMVSALYGHFTLRSPWKRAALFLSAVPLAIVGNLVRIIMLTLGILLLGAPTAIGTLEKPTFFHQLAGYAVFLVALGGMILVGQALNTSRADWSRRWHSIKSDIGSSQSPSAETHTRADPY
jgi:exosortase